MSDEKNPLEHAVDQAVEAFVYAPIGLLFDGPALFPKLVERGKNQVNVARMMGQMAVQMGQAEAGKRLAETSGPVRDALESVGLVQPESKVAPAPAPAASPTPTAKPTPAKPVARVTKAARASTKAAAASATTTAKASTTKAKGAATTAKAAASKATAAAASLGIPDYDSLSASQVVTRLRGLAAAELDAVKSYETTARARKTILNRIAQLQKG